MKLILRDKATYILRFDRGEEVIGELKRFCRQEKIQAGWLTALGAANEVELAWYDVKAKRYHTKTWQEKLEIAGVTGNVSIHEGEVVVHAHGTFSDLNMTIRAGHINRMVVAVTCEMTLHKLVGALEREYSAEIGLKLLR